MPGGRPAIPEVTQFCTEESLEEYQEEQKEEEGDELKRYVTPTDIFQRVDTFDIAAIPEDTEVNDDHIMEMDQRDSLMYASTNHLTN